MTIAFHPEPESLMSCSAGSMPEAFAAVMASHITMCRRCQCDLALLQDIGAALFERIEPTATSSDAPIMKMRAAEADPLPRETLPSIRSAAAGDVPSPLVGTLGATLDHIAFTPVAPGISQRHVPLSPQARGTLRLVKIAPGLRLPAHNHAGSELSMVLRGAFTDSDRRYGVGDVADLGEDMEHAPLADPIEGCICLVATEGKLRFKSRLARLLQPWTGF